MSEPTGATAATLATTTAALAAPAFGVDPLIAIGAITGAGIFVMSHDQQGAVKKLALFIGSVACGFLGARLAADLVATLIPGGVAINDGVGAIIASSVSVRILQRLIGMLDSPASLQDIIRGKRQ